MYFGYPNSLQCQLTHGNHKYLMHSNMEKLVCRRANLQAAMRHTAKIVYFWTFTFRVSGMSLCRISDLYIVFGRIHILNHCFIYFKSFNRTHHHLLLLKHFSLNEFFDAQVISSNIVKFKVLGAVLQCIVIIDMARYFYYCTSLPLKWMTK